MSQTVQKWEQELANDVPLPASPESFATPSASPGPPTPDFCHCCHQLTQELQEVRTAWGSQRTKYLGETFEVVRLNRLLEACDAAFDRVKTYATGSLPSGPSMSEIASNIMKDYQSDRLEQSLLQIRAVADLRNSELNEKAQGLLEINRTFFSAASAFYDELDTLAAWINVRVSELKEMHEAYQDMVRESGKSPQLLYTRSKELKDCEAAFEEAFALRKAAMLAIVETVQLDEVSELFAKVYRK